MSATLLHTYSIFHFSYFTYIRYTIDIMSLFSRHSQKDVELALVYDIGSASVGGALVLFAREKKPKIIYSVRHDMVFQKELDTARMEQSMYSAVVSVSEDLVKNGIPHLRFTKFGSLHPKRAFCTFASPWTVSQTRSIHVAFDRPQKVRQSDIEKRVVEERKVFLESKDVAELIGEDEHVIIEEKVTRVLLNGYETSQLESEGVRTIDVSAVFSVAPLEVVQRISEEIQKSFSSCEVSFHSFSAVFFNALRDVIKEKVRDFIMIDISGEVSDVSIVNDMNLVETVTFPVGKKTIIRHVAELAGVGTEEALSYIHLSREGEITGKTRKKIVNAIQSARDMWYRSYEHALTDLADTHMLSHTIYFTCDSDVRVWFRDVIDDAEMIRFGAERDESIVHSVDSLYVKGHCDIERDVVSDVFLMTGAICAQKIFIS